MKPFKDIYAELCDKRGYRYSLRELLYIFVAETSWIGEAQQLNWLKSLLHEITQIRPGDCPGCNLESVKNMVRWVTKYEEDNGITYIHNPEND